MKRVSLCLPVVLLLWGGHALAVGDPREMLHDRTLELRAEAIGRQLRCLVCQNESVEASDADLARDLRHIVREQVAAGASDRDRRASFYSWTQTIPLPKTRAASSITGQTRRTTTEQREPA